MAKTQGSVLAQWTIAGNQIWPGYTWTTWWNPKWKAASHKIASYLGGPSQMGGVSFPTLYKGKFYGQTRKENGALLVNVFWGRASDHHHPQHHLASPETQRFFLVLLSDKAPSYLKELRRVKTEGHWTGSSDVLWICDYKEKKIMFWVNTFWRLRHPPKKLPFCWINNLY